MERVRFRDTYCCVIYRFLLIPYRFVATMITITRRVTQLHIYLLPRRFAIGLTAEPDRPFTLPPGKFKPKQSLSQNFLSDQNYVLKIVNAFDDDSEVELSLILLMLILLRRERE